ncbi:MAG: NADH-quinone oxidoreductase subunit J [Cytophagales bacterium]
MIVQQIIFYIFSALTVCSAIFLLLTKNIVHAAFSFLAVLLGVAISFVYMNAEFLAVSQILIYVGGVLVLLIFGVMLTNASAFIENSRFSFQQFFLIAIAMVFGAILIYALQKVDFINQQYSPNANIENITLPQKVGYFLITDFIVPFEASGVLLLIALIGAATIAGSKRQSRF